MYLSDNFKVFIMGSQKIGTNLTLDVPQKVDTNLCL